MKPTGIIGIILIILGVVLLAYRGIPYAEQQKAEIGPIRLTATEERTFLVPRVVSVVVVASGVVLLIAGLRKG